MGESHERLATTNDRPLAQLNVCLHRAGCSSFIQLACQQALCRLKLS